MNRYLSIALLLLFTSSAASDPRLPAFHARPESATVTEGATATLTCISDKSSSSLVSSTEWLFRGKPLSASRKHLLSHDRQQLRIFPFLDADVGTYTCRLRNAYGHSDASAQLSMLRSAAPSIVDTPQSQEVLPGSPAHFRCRASGVPRPSIAWFVDGERIQAGGGNRFKITGDGTELTLEHATRQDEAVYSCQAFNPVGSIIADAKLRVKVRVELDTAINDMTIRAIVSQATENVNKAINTTRDQLAADGMQTVHDLRRQFRFAVSLRNSEMSRAREIYEESIRLIYQHISNGLMLDVADISPNVSYESVLPPNYVHALMEQSGCQNGQFKTDPCEDMCFHAKYRTYDGQCNNLDDPMRGVSQWPLKRLLPPIYENGFNTPVGWQPDRLYYGYKKPNAREVSRALISTKEVTPHGHLSAFTFQWGQFVDHDLTLTAPALTRHAYRSGALCNYTCENVDPCFNIQLQPGDPKLVAGNPHHAKFPCMEFERNGAICGSGETSLIFQRVTYRDQMNILTSYLDASGVYGSTEVQAIELRDLFSDHGLLKFDIVSDEKKPYLPFEEESDMDCRRNFSDTQNPIKCFLAGDLRANEQLALTAMHTLFLREHNRIAGRLLLLNPLWDGERIFQETRKIVGAFMQHITYAHWMPKVLGKSGFDTLIGPFAGYDPDEDASASNEFAAAAFRFGHTLINPILRRLDANFTSIPQGDIRLHEAFFANERLLSEGGIDPLLRGLFATPLKLPRPTQILNSELTEFLYSKGHDVALDLAAFNIQRGRDHGLPGWTEYRRMCHLSVPSTWEEMASIVRDAGVLGKLRQLYGHPGNIDLWVGGVTEARLPEALMGPTFACIIADQFKRTRAGDRFWYENPGVFTRLQLAQIKKISIARLLCDNGDRIERVQRDVFMYPGNSTQFYEPCSRHPAVNLNMWQACDGGVVAEESMGSANPPPSSGTGAQIILEDDDQLNKKLRRRRSAAGTCQRCREQDKKREP